MMMTFDEFCPQNKINDNSNDIFDENLDIEAKNLVETVIADVLDSFYLQKQDIRLDSIKNSYNSLDENGIREKSVTESEKTSENLANVRLRIFDEDGAEISFVRDKSDLESKLTSHQEEPAKLIESKEEDSPGKRFAEEDFINSNDEQLNKEAEKLVENIIQSVLTSFDGVEDKNFAKLLQENQANSNSTSIISKSEFENANESENEQFHAHSSKDENTEEFYTPKSSEISKISDEERSHNSLENDCQILIDSHQSIKIPISTSLIEEIEIKVEESSEQNFGSELSISELEETGNCSNYPLFQQAYIIEPEELNRPIVISPLPPIERIHQPNKDQSNLESEPFKQNDLCSPENTNEKLYDIAQSKVPNFPSRPFLNMNLQRTQFGTSLEFDPGYMSWSNWDTRPNELHRQTTVNTEMPLEFEMSAVKLEKVDNDDEDAIKDPLVPDYKNSIEIDFNRSAIPYSYSLESEALTKSDSSEDEFSQFGPNLKRCKLSEEQSYVGNEEEFSLEISMVIDQLLDSADQYIDNFREKGNQESELQQNGTDERFASENNDFVSCQIEVDSKSPQGQTAETNPEMFQDIKIVAKHRFPESDDEDGESTSTTTDEFSDVHLNADKKLENEESDKFKNIFRENHVNDKNEENNFDAFSSINAKNLQQDNFFSPHFIQSDIISEEKEEEDRDEEKEDKFAEPAKGEDGTINYFEENKTKEIDNSILFQTNNSWKSEIAKENRIPGSYFHQTITSSSDDEEFSQNKNAKNSVIESSENEADDEDEDVVEKAEPSKNLIKTSSYSKLEDGYKNLDDSEEWPDLSNEQNYQEIEFGTFNQTESYVEKIKPAIAKETIENSKKEEFPNLLDSNFKSSEMTINSNIILPPPIEQRKLTEVGKLLRMMSRYSVEVEDSSSSVNINVQQTSLPVNSQLINQLTRLDGLQQALQKGESLREADLLQPIEINARDLDVLLSLKQREEKDIEIDVKEKPSEKRVFSKNTTAFGALDGIELPTGLIVAITGANSGIGVETVRALALKDAQVVMFCRNLESAQEIRDKIIKEKDDANIEIIKCDLNSLASVKEAAESYMKKGWPLHVLILNAGVWGPPNKLTEDGFETHFGVNHLGHFYLTKLLSSVLEKSAPSRLVVLSSEAHRRTHLESNISVDQLTPNILSPMGPVSAFKFRNDYLMYGMSKLCNIWFANAFAHRYKDKQINTYSLHPGTMIATGITRNTGIGGKLIMGIAKYFNKTIEQGAATTVYCATAPELNKMSGNYYQDCAIKQPHPIALREELQEKLWQISEQAVDKFENYRKLVESSDIK